MQITTEQLFHALQDAKLEDFATIFQKYQLGDVQPHELLNQLILASGYKKTHIRDQLGGSNYIFEVCAGTKKHPSRDFILEVLLFIGANVSDCQTILKYFGHTPLYPKNMRDIYLLYAFNEGFSLEEINLLLSTKNLPTFIKD